MKPPRPILHCAGAPLSAIVADAAPYVPSHASMLPPQESRTIPGTGDKATGLARFALSSCAYASKLSSRGTFQWRAGYASRDAWRAMLAIEHDTVTLQVTYRADQSVLLSLQHGLIIGSRWLCIVRVGEWNRHLATLLGSRRESDSVADARRILRSSGLPVNRSADYLQAGKNASAFKVAQ